MISHGDSGSASRFFYSAKADADDRLGSKHPTVKPVDLMRWLLRLVLHGQGWHGRSATRSPAPALSTGEAAWRGLLRRAYRAEPALAPTSARRMALCTLGLLRPASARRPARPRRGGRKAPEFGLLFRRPHRTGGC